MSDTLTEKFLVIPDDFFETNKMILLEALPKGQTYINIFLKLMLHSLKYEGDILNDEGKPYPIPDLAKKIRHECKDVEETLALLYKMGLIKIRKDNRITFCSVKEHTYVEEIQNGKDKG